MAIIKHRDMDLEQLYDALENTGVDSGAHKMLMDQIVRKQVETAMRAADAAEKSAKAATMASRAALITALAAFLTLLVRSLGWF